MSTTNVAVATLKSREVLEFTPPFYLCCVAHICPAVNSANFVRGVLSSMRCCKTASPLMSDLLTISGIDFIFFEEGRVGIIPEKDFDREALRESVLAVLRRHR